MKSNATNTAVGIAFVELHRFGAELVVVPDHIFRIAAEALLVRLPAVKNVSEAQRLDRDQKL